MSYEDHRKLDLFLQRRNQRLLKKKTELEFVYEMLLCYRELQKRFCIFSKTEFESLHIGVWVSLNRIVFHDFN
jgi:hypothetical protein